MKKSSPCQRAEPGIFARFRSLQLVASACAASAEDSGCGTAVPWAGYPCVLKADRFVREDGVSVILRALL